MYSHLYSTSTCRKIYIVRHEWYVCLWALFVLCCYDFAANIFDFYSVSFVSLLSERSAALPTYVRTFFFLHAVYMHVRKMFCFKIIVLISHEDQC